MNVEQIKSLINFYHRDKCHLDQTIITKTIKSNGTKSYRLQCLSCGQGSSGLKFELIDQSLEYPLFNDDISSLYWSMEHDLKVKEQNLLRENERQNWLLEHNKYLQTDTWNHKRNKRLNFDDYLCQGCFESTATQVHHLSYKNWQDELMFELISVCNECHIKIHNNME